MVDVAVGALSLALALGYVDLAEAVVPVDFSKPVIVLARAVVEVYGLGVWEEEVGICLAVDRY